MTGWSNALYGMGAALQIELELGNVGFWGEGKTGVPGEKPLGVRTRTNNKFWVCQDGIFRWKLLTDHYSSVQPSSTVSSVVECNIS